MAFSATVSEFRVRRMMAERLWALDVSGAAAVSQRCAAIDQVQVGSLQL